MILAIFETSGVKFNESVKNGRHVFDFGMAADCAK
jgi:hypothetical protein